MNQQYAPIREPDPVPIVAIAANWRFRGETVVPGQTYRVHPADAQSLVYAGKARPA